MKDGGPAFPIPNATDMDGYVFAPEASGMSLRDYFAAKAMQALLIRMHDETIADHMASNAYGAADRMLKERDK